MSTLRVDNITPSAGGTEYSLDDGVGKTRWSYDQSGNINQESHNVSSINDENTGQYSIFMTNLMATTTYSPVATAEDDGGNERVIGTLSNGAAVGRTTNETEFGVTNGGNVSVDTFSFGTNIGSLA